MGHFWVIVVILVVLAAIFLFAFNPFKTVAQPEPETGDGNADVFEDANQDSLIEPVSPPVPVFSDLSACEFLPGSQKSDCVSQVAESRKDLGLCATLSGEDVAWCQKDVIVANGDERGCDSLPLNQRNQCHFDFGYNTDSIASCQKISLRYWADDCLRFVAQHTVQLDACNSISDSDVKDDCVLYIATETQNQSLCAQIKDSETRKTCTMAFEPFSLPGGENIPSNEG